MIAFYRTRPVRDDDIDAIRDAMEVKQHIADYADDPQYGNVVILLEAAVEILRTRHVVIDDDGTVWGKEMETFRLGASGGGYYHDEEAFAPCYESFYEGFGNWDGELVSANDELADRESEGPADLCEGHLLKERVRVVLSSLQDLERQVIDFRFGLSDGYSRTLEEVGRLFNTTREGIRQIEANALRKMRHPLRIRSIWEYQLSDDVVPPKSVGGMSQDDEKSRAIHRQLHRKIRVGSVEMSLASWLQILDLDEDAYCCYAESCNVGRAELVASSVIDMYLADVALWNGLDANELAEAVGNGYSVSQVLSGECDIPVNAGSLIVGFGEYEKTLAEWFDDSSYAEEERERARKSVFGCGRFSLEPVGRLIRQHAEQVRLAELERVERARLEEVERKNPIIKYDGKSLRASEWAGIFGLPQGVITVRYRNNWNVEDVLHIPYPCGAVVKIDGRRYTEEMLRKKFGIGMKEYWSYWGKWDITPPARGKSSSSR